MSLKTRETLNLQADAHTLVLPALFQSTAAPCSLKFQSHRPTKSPPRTIFIGKVCRPYFWITSARLKSMQKSIIASSLCCAACRLTHGQVLFADLVCEHGLCDSQQHARKYNFSQRRYADAKQPFEPLTQDPGRQLPRFSPSKFQSRREWKRVDEGPRRLILLSRHSGLRLGLATVLQSTDKRNVS